MNQDKIIEALVMRRKQLRLSQHDLAKLTGIKQPAISRIEKMKVHPTVETVIVIADALGLQLGLKKNNE